MKTRTVKYADGREGQSFRCEGCGGNHTVVTKGEGPNVWSWNGDSERPVFTPSVLVSLEYTDGRPTHVCHSFVGCYGAEPGEIIFLSDCTHALAGQVRPLPEWSWPPDPEREEA